MEGKTERMISDIKRSTLDLLASSGAENLPADQYTRMQYPKFLPLMVFTVDQYRIKGFGHVMLMHTTTKMGMELLTMSLMPGEGMTLPYLLIDAMSMKKKRCVFVEYYGCGYEPLTENGLPEVHEKYRSLPEYPEKPNWYIHERQPYSLIKTGTAEEMCKMTADSLSAYLGLTKKANADPAYLANLKAFRQRMITEGNPSSKTLEMLLKKDGAVRFMEEVVMPVRE